MKAIKNTLRDARTEKGTVPLCPGHCSCVESVFLRSLYACFMSGLEATHAINGYADYYCVSEESEPGDGWDYKALLKKMTENPTMNSAQVGRTIADTYTDYYMKENLNVSLHKFNKGFPEYSPGYQSASIVLGCHFSSPFYKKFRF